MNLVKRSIVAVLGIPVLLFIALNRAGWPDHLFAAAVISVSIFEILNMFAIKSPLHHLAAISAGLLHLAGVIYGFSPEAPFLLLILFLLPSEALIFNNSGKRDVKRVFVTVFAPLYVSSFFAYFVRLKQDSLMGPAWAMALFISVWVIDSAAYFIGMLLGRRRGLVAVSPKKSIAGFVGGFIIPLMFSPLFSHYLNISLINGIILLAILSISVQAGDLSESLLKRYAGVKDSGRILGPHGGIFDRFDSMIFSLPLFYWVAGLLIN